MLGRANFPLLRSRVLLMTNEKLLDHAAVDIVGAIGSQHHYRSWRAAGGKGVDHFQIGIGLRGEHDDPAGFYTPHEMAHRASTQVPVLAQRTC